MSHKKEKETGQPLTRRNWERERLVREPGGESRTKQSFAEEADINFIVKKFAQTGVLPGNDNRQPQYADVSNYDDLQASLAMIDQAELEFGQLPSAVREAAGNNPGTLLQLMGSAAGQERLEAAGMILRDPIAASESAPPQVAVAQEPVSEKEA